MLQINKKLFMFTIIVLSLSFLSGYLGGSFSKKDNEQQWMIGDEKKSSSLQKEIRHTEPNSISIAAKRAMPSVVNISFGNKNISDYMLRNNSKSSYKPMEKRYFSVGSGVIVSHDGYIITNNHVIENLGGNISVNIFDGRKFKAQLIGADPKTDLAVIKIDAENLPIIKIADSDNASVGDMVIAVGNPFGIGETVTMGIISAVGRSNIGIVEYENFIQTDAAINPGSSGGALVNTNGELVGINTAILTKSGGYEGIGFAIPSNMAKKVFKNIVKKGRVERGWLGAAVQDVNVEMAKFFSEKIIKGVMITEVVKDSPAFISGLQKGDIIISVNKKEIKNKTQVKNDIAEAPVGKEIEIKIIRNGKTETLPVKISKMPENMEIFDVNNIEFTNK